MEGREPCLVLLITVPLIGTLVLDKYLWNECCLGHTGHSSHSPIERDGWETPAPKFLPFHAFNKYKLDASDNADSVGW